MVRLLATDTRIQRLQVNLTHIYDANWRFSAVEVSLLLMRIGKKDSKT